ncbi:MAG: DUF4139 domain-containing protein, partial [Planctomycetes bacterium]|nr:DUF4139 domain-containing protein [Planctomycetota bacterium]
MRRTYWIGGSLAVLGLVGALVLLKPHSSSAEPEKNAANVSPPMMPAAAAPLPINRVVLFSSGVGYFQREGEVQGSTRIDLAFPAQDINDLLKSLTL